MSNLKIGISCENKFSDFDNEIKLIARKKIEEFLVKISRSICKKFKLSTRSIFADCFNCCSNSFWEDLENAFMNEIDHSLNEFDTLCDSFSKNEILKAAKNELENVLSAIYRETLVAESSKSTMILRFTKNMDKNFRFDLNGRPRHWESLDSIDKAFDKALNKVKITIRTKF